MRVLKWMIDRIEGQTQQVKKRRWALHPQYGEINWSGLNFSAEQFATVTQHRQGRLGRRDATAHCPL